MTINDVTKFKKELRANIIDSCVSFNTRVISTFYSDSDDMPTYDYRDGERICIFDALQVIIDNKYFYIDVSNNYIEIYTPNYSRKRFDLVHTFFLEDYKNKTSLSMAIGCKLIKEYSK